MTQTLTVLRVHISIRILTIRTATHSSLDRRTVEHLSGSCSRCSFGSSPLSHLSGHCTGQCRCTQLHTLACSSARTMLGARGRSDCWRTWCPCCSAVDVPLSPLYRTRCALHARVAGYTYNTRLLQATGGKYRTDHQYRINRILY